MQPYPAPTVLLSRQVEVSSPHQSAHQVIRVFSNLFSKLAAAEDDMYLLLWVSSDPAGQEMGSQKAMMLSRGNALRGPKYRRCRNSCRYVTRKIDSFDM